MASPVESPPGDSGAAAAPSVLSDGSGSFIGPDGKAWPSKQHLIAERKKLIGYNVALNYSKMPLYIVRGKAQHLYDEKGEEYLDCVNNVSHVGHCHPDVVAASCDQMHTLNTNSRYLSPYLVEYAKRLTATMPSPLSVVFWVNSGSEANDLALRLARAHTGKRGVMTVGGAYHGHVISIIDISPYKYERHGGTGQRGWVREAPIPDCHSGIYRGDVEDERLGAAYAGEVESLLGSFARQEQREKARKEAWLVAKKELEAKRAAAAAAAGGAGAASPAPCEAAAAAGLRRYGAVHSDGFGGHNPPGEDAEAEALAFDYDNDGLTAGCGAFIMESVLSCGGQVMPPKGYLRRVYAAVRKAGGVTIADEVQVGFGRVGSHMWAFQLQGEDVVPDIVTLGKPMGNGFPVAMVVTTPAIAASFAAGGMEYFNTYGGNPVAARIALSVLDVIEKEKLQAHAAVVGKALLDGFNTRLYPKHTFIGSVRGVGMMVGLEIIKDRADEARVPWTEAASAIVYAMRKRRILLSTDGMASNVIKLKPPMAFTAADAETVIANLEEVMGDLETHLAAFRAL